MEAGSVPDGSNPSATRLGTYVGALAILAAVLAATWIYWYGLELSPRILVATALLAGVALLGDVLSVRVSGQAEVGTWDIALVLAVAAAGPTWAALAAVPAALFVGGRDRLRVVYEVGKSFVIVYPAGIVFSSVSGPLLVDVSRPPAAVFYGTLAAGVTLVVSNETINCGMFWVKYGQPPRETWEEVMRPYLASDVANVLTAGLGALTLAVYGPMAAAVVVAGAIVSRALARRSREQVEKIRGQHERIKSLEDTLTASNATFGTMMVQEMGRKDGYTHRHATATSVYAADLAREMKLDDARVKRLRLAGLLHNIGMFGLPEELLLSAGRLNSVAQHQVAEHPVRGQTVLGAVPEYEEMASWVRWHHERPDGRGYPDKLRDAWIPLEAKILAVAQAYAAMVLDGPRRPGMDPAQARREMGEGVDTQFDGLVVRAFLRILDTETEGYRMADDHRFAFMAHDGRGDFGSDGGRGRTAAP